MRGPEAAQHRAEFEQWLAADPRHREAYSTLQDAWQASAGFGETEIGRNRSLDRVRSPFAPTLPRVAALAAAVAAVLLVVFLRPGGEGPVPSPVQTAMLMQTTVGEIRTLDLPDGSKVTLDTNSQIQVRFEAQARRVELVRGRARFEVRADPARAFIVEAGDTQVAAPEGRFDAALLPQGVCVSAWRGALDVRHRGAGYSQAAIFRLNPGRSVVFRAGQESPSEAPVAASGAEQWVAGMLVYKSRPLSEVLAETNRYSRQQIVLGDPSIGKLRVTGTFRPVPVDALAASLAAAFGLRIRTDTAGNLVLQPG